jgi:hypothetical protein
MGKHGSRIVVLVLAMAILFAAMQFGAEAARRPRAKSKSKAGIATLIVFPVDVGVDIKVPDSFGSDVATALRTSMVGNGKYALFLFSEKMAPMRRAKDDGTLTKRDIDGPYADDKEKTDKLVDIMAADFYFVGSVSDAAIDAPNKKASATVSGNLVDEKAGRIVKAVLVVADVPESMGFTDDKSLASALARAVADQLAIQLTKSESSTEPTK